METLIIIAAVWIIIGMASFHFVMPENDKEYMEQHKLTLTIFILSAPFVVLFVAFKFLFKRMF